MAFEKKVQASKGPFVELNVDEPVITTRFGVSSGGEYIDSTSLKGDGGLLVESYSDDEFDQDQELPPPKELEIKAQGTVSIGTAIAKEQPASGPAILVRNDA
jgi:hypothetical protein